MVLARFAVSALALASTVFADDCSSDKTVNIQNSGDAATIGQCTKYKGNVAVDSKMTDDITWDKIEELDGDFLIKGVQGLKRVAAPKLKTITGKLEVNDASQLAALGFDALTEVKELTLLGLANLRSLTFSKKISKCDKLRVENTKLESLMGIDLMTASSIVIANNPMIANISMQTTNITGPLDLSFNNADVIVSFPNLEQARNISMRAVGNLSLPALSTVDPGSFGIFSSKIKSFYAQNLTEIKEAVTIVNCDNLTDISFASLTKVGASFLITNNTALGNVTQLPKLEEVGAALDISGNLTKVETPSLQYVRGVFNVQSTTDLGNSCDFYNDLKSKKKVPTQKYKCEGKLEKAGTAGSSSNSKDGSSDKKNAGSPLNVQIVSLGFAVFAAVLLV